MAQHTFTQRDGTIVITTWHDTKADAQARVASIEDNVATRSILPGGALGRYRAVTWQRP